MLVIAVADWWTGPEIRVSIFYVAVVAFTAWWLGRNVGLAFAGLSTLSICLADHWPISPQTNLLVATWNTLAMLVLFFAFVLLVAKRRTQADALARLVQQRTAALQQAEQQAHSSEAQLGVYVHSSGDGIITIDQTGAVAAFNPAAERIFGYGASEVVGRPLTQLMPPPYREKHARHLEQYLAGGQGKCIGQNREVLGQRKNGTVFPMELMVTEVQLGQRRLFTGTVRDITQRRQLEQEVLNISDRERQRIAQDLHDGLCQHLTATEFASQILTEKLAERALPEAADAQQIAGFVGEAIRQAREIARGLHPVEIGSGGLVAALTQLALRMQRTARIDCCFEAESKAVPLSDAENTHCYRITQEAIANALKHGRASHISIKLTVAHDQVVLTVQDNGQGLPACAVNHDGLGLRIMNHRARLMGAALDVRRAAQGGTLLTLSVPQRDWTGRKGEL